MSAAPTEPDRRPALAILCNSLPPYRLHAHARIASEIPELRLLTISTHVDATRDWKTSLPAEIGHLDLSNGDRVARGASISYQLRERTRGPQLVAALKQHNTAAVIINGYNDLGRLRVVNWCRKNRVPAFIWSDSNIRDEDGKPGALIALKKAFVRRLAKRVAGFFACGELGREYWLRYGVRPEQVFISPYEPDYRQIQEISSSQIADALARHGLEPARRRIVFSGRLAPVKRVDLLLDAFTKIAAERPEWDLVLLGDGELRQSLQSRTPESLADRIHWLGFLAEQAEVSRLYRGSDLLALPSDREPWALVINEAVAAGMAVVATDVVAAAHELVRDRTNGRLVPCGDLDALTDALRGATAPENINTYKAASADALAAWRRRGDPVEGVRAALRSVGVLSSP